MKDEEKSYVVKIDDTISSLIEIRRYGEVDGGFQRKLSIEVVNKILKAVRKGETIPPILLAKIENKFRLIDGQHRYHAWLAEKYDLWAQVNPMRPMEAVEAFCTINGTARKISLKHQLSVDPSQYAKKVREVSLKFDVEPRVIHAVLTDLVGGSGRHLTVEIVEWKLLEDFLHLWSNDKRWKSKGSIYDSYGTMLMVIRILKRSKNPLETIKLLKTLDYKKEGSLGIRYGGSSSAARVMANFAVNSLIRKGLI